ncbi:MAG: discoidin domain-containing protein, partial [Sporichthyaceae bacterium]|nr:discoidin domain-containing protein [Sporichthyaceae bacterium]
MSLSVPIDRGGRYVKVQLRGQNYLCLPEVEVWDQLQPPGPHLAEGKPASQSSTYGGSVAGKAVDGTTDGNGEAANAITGNQAQAWWQVDLQQVRQLGHVVLWNRTDGWSERLADFDLKVSDDGTTWQAYYVAGPVKQNVAIPVDRTGRYIRVQLRGTNYLQLAEVQVWEPSLSAAPPVDSEWVVTTYSYDAQGNRASVTDGRGNTTTLCWDVADDGSTISGTRRNLTRAIGPPPTGGANRPVTLLTYDGKDNLTKVVPPKGVASGGTVTCATDLSGAINTTYATEYAYDATQTTLLSITERFTDPDSGLQTAVTKLEYDAAQPGLVSKVIPP